MEYGKYVEAAVGGLIAIVAVAIGLPIAIGFINPTVTNSTYKTTYPTTVTVFTYLPTIFALVGLFGLLFIVMKLSGNRD